MIAKVVPRWYLGILALPPVIFVSRPSCVAPCDAVPRRGTMEHITYAGADWSNCVTTTDRLTTGQHTEHRGNAGKKETLPGIRSIFGGGHIFLPWDRGPGSWETFAGAEMTNGADGANGQAGRGFDQ